MAIKTQVDLQTEIDTNLADNTSQDISAADVRNVVTNINDTFFDLEYTHPTGDGNLHVPATSTTNDGKVLTAGPTAGSLTWETPSSFDAASPGPIGGTTPSTGAFTTLMVSDSIVNSAATTFTILSGGTTTALGGNFVAFGQTHASQANDWALRNAATNIISYDASVGNVTHSSNSIFSADMSVVGDVLIGTGTLDTYGGSAVQFDDGTNIMNYIDQTLFVNSQAHWNGTNWIYNSALAGCLTAIQAGSYAIYTTPSGGVAGNVIANEDVEVKFSVTATEITAHVDIITTGTVDGRDVSVDGTTLDGLEAVIDPADIDAGNASSVSTATIDGGTAAVARNVYRNLLLMPTVRTSAFTAAVSETNKIDSSGGIFTVTMPASPVEGDRCGFIDTGNLLNTNNVTLARNGSKIMDVAADYTLSTNSFTGTFLYIAEDGWVIT